MSGFSIPNHLTIHLDATAISFERSKKPEELAQILAARKTYAVWDKKSGFMSYAEFAQKFMFPENTRLSRKRLEVFLSHFLGHLKAGATRSLGALSEAEKNYHLLLNKINQGAFFSSFDHFFSALKKENALGKKHTLVLRVSEEDFKWAESMIHKSYPDIEFARALFVDGNEGVQLKVLDSGEATADLSKMQKIFDRSRYWLVKMNSESGPFPCSPKAGRVYCFLTGQEGEKNAIQVKPEEAAFKDTYFFEMIPKGGITQESAPVRSTCRYSRMILFALTLAVASCLIPDSFLKREPL